MMEGIKFVDDSELGNTLSCALDPFKGHTQSIPTTKDRERNQNQGKYRALVSSSKYPTNILSSLLY